ncbi:MAG: DUF5011 domain-containing protein [Flavobacteriaceae bacterium]|nr:DUF5011 domain-containing protein [Flavobacteriaceae bacterium]
MKKIQLILFSLLLTSFYASAQVCTPTMATKCCNIGISNISVSTSINYSISNYNTGISYYNEYPNYSACVTAGKKYFLSVTTQSGANQQAICVWVDWDKNDTFSSSEIIMSTNQIAAGGKLDDSLPVPSNQTSGNYRMRVMVDWYNYYAGGGAFDPCTGHQYGDFVDLKIAVVGSGGTDLGIESVLQPYVLTISNNNPVEFTYTNLAGNNIDSFIAGYALKGGSAVTESVTKTRSGSTLNLATCETDTFLFSQNLSISQAGNYDLKMWVSYANGSQPDANQSNDSMQTTACTSLSGNYTIDKSQSTSGNNYSDFSSAVAAINQCGISGPVIFTVAAGTYTESVILGAVNGASATNTITFDGVDTANRIIQSTVSGAITFTLDEASFIRFKHITFKAGQFGYDMELAGGCTDILIDSCNFRVVSTATPASYGINFNANKGGNSPATHVTISNCVVKEMGYGIWMNGGNTNGANNIILRNKVGATTYGMIIQYQDSLLVSENIVRSAGAYGIYAYEGDYNNFTRNDVDMDGSVCGMFYNQSNTGFVNNIFSGGGNVSSTVQLQTCSDFQFYHNTCYNSNTSGYAGSFSSCTNADVRNNIFHMTGTNSYCFYGGTSGQFSYLDFNVYHNANNSSNYAYLGGDYKDLAALKGQFGYNMYAVNAKPPFVNISSTPRNLHLSSATIPSYGDYTIGVAIDIDSNSRCSIAPTIGADESKYVITMPVSDFVCPDTGYINSPVFFKNKGSYTQGKFFDWYMDGAAQPTYTSEDAWHTFNATGSKEVKLNTINCTGSHDTSKYVLIVTPTKAPVVYFRADKTNIEISDEVQFMDSSTIGAVSWNWTISGGTGLGLGIDFDYTVGDSMSQHPKVQFYNAGFYTICLTATNSVGATTLCKTNYIKVNSLMMMCSGVTVADMFGRFYDEGGKAGYATNNSAQPKVCADLIAPCSGPVIMTFTSVNFDSNSATLKIYDGVDASGKQLNKNGVKPGATLTAQTGSMFILWEQQAWTSYIGWEASWDTKSQYVAKAPASINVGDTGYSYGTQTYEVKYYTAGVQYDWDYDNDGTIDFQGRSGDYTYGAAGTYTCVCYATSCGGVDTVTKDVLVLDPTTPPEPVQFVMDVTNGSACKLRPRTIWAVENGVSVTLMDKSGRGPTAWEWEVVGANTANYSWDNSNSIQNPTITFVVNGFYTISLKVTNVAGSNVDTFYQVIKVVNAHCTPTVTSPGPDYFGITRFNFRDISTNTSAYTGYSQTASPMPCVESGTFYKFALKRGSTTTNARAAIWIDYNQDGDFTDAGELVKSTQNLNALTWSDSFKISKLSNMVLWGQAHMRVGITDPSNQFFTCANNSVGEFEDYLIYIIDDLTAPVITLIGSDTLKTEQGLTYKDLGAIAFDALDGYIPTISSTNLNTANLGYYWLKYDAKDKAGNYAYPVYRTVEVTADKSAPVITLLGNNPYYHNVNTSFTDPWATAYDSVDGNINNITTKGTVNTTVLGSYQIWYYAQDGKGYKDSVMRTVVVQDIAPPSLTLNGKDTIHLAVLVQYVDAGWSVNDNYDPNPTVTMSPAKIDSSVLQTTTITYTAKDAIGNSSSKTRVVIVEDLIAPVINLNGASPLYHEVKTTYTEPGAIVTDNHTTGITPVITGGPVNPNVIGSYTLTYTATDASGNTASIDRDVIVQKKTKPTVHLNGQDTVYLLVNQTYGDPGVNSISDNYYSSAQLITLLQSSSTFANPATAPGTYYTWYFVTDPSSNTDTATRTFIVETTGIRSVNELSPITLWPNPANDMLNIKGLSNGTNQVTLYDAAGKQVLTEKIKGENGTLNTATLAAGVYILKAVNDGKMSIARFEIAR